MPVESVQFCGTNAKAVVHDDVMQLDYRGNNLICEP